jgi:hypothetical protein
MQVYHTKNGKISEVQIGAIDDKDIWDNNFAEREIYEQLRNNVGLVGSNGIISIRWSITKNGQNFFFRIFYSRLTYHQVRNKFCWQAKKRLEDDNMDKDSLAIKEYVNKYRFFGKIVRVNKVRHII